jgi:hypothetical protein
VSYIHLTDKYRREIKRVGIMPKILTFDIGIDIDILIRIKK